MENVSWPMWGAWEEEQRQQFVQKTNTYGLFFTSGALCTALGAHTITQSQLAFCPSENNSKFTSENGEEKVTSPWEHFTQLVFLYKVQNDTFNGFYFLLMLLMKTRKLSLTGEAIWSYKNQLQTAAAEPLPHAQGLCKPLKSPLRT